jgi:NTE family protein
VALELAQDSTYVADEYWRWSVWLEPTSEAELDQVDHVVYTLHPTFPNPVQTVRDRSTKFRLTTEGWGTFRLFATVVYIDGTEQVLQLDLRFDYPAETQRPGAPKPEAPPEEASVVAGATEVSLADGIFEGSGMKAVAFAGALMAAREVAGIEKWVNVAGTSAGSIVATLLAAGYRPDQIKDILLDADYRRFTHFGFLAGIFNMITRRGLVRRTYVADWLSHLLADSPLGDPNPPFAAFAHPGRTADLSPRSKFSLRIIASDISGSRMLVLPDDLDGYEDEQGRPLSREDFKVLDAVKMSISAPFLYTPSTLYRKGRPHYIVDGSLLSTFPLSLFDDPLPLRPTWGFRLHNVGGDQELRYRRISGPLAMLRLGMAVVASVMDAWDKQRVPADTAARTVIIPTSGFRSPSQALSREQMAELFEVGYAAGRDFFGPVLQYTNSFGAELTHAPAVAPTLDR